MKGGPARAPGSPAPLAQGHRSRGRRDTQTEGRRDTQTEGRGTAGGGRAGWAAGARHTGHSARVCPHSPLRRPGPILFSCFLLHFTLILLLS